jgi:hypothetical protein
MSSEGEAVQRGAVCGIAGAPGCMAGLAGRLIPVLGLPGEVEPVAEQGKCAAGTRTDDLDARVLLQSAGQHYGG